MIPTTKFEKIKKIINERKYNELITRACLHTVTGDTREKITTTDTYRHILTEFGVLELTQKRGTYQVKKHIKEKTTISLLQKILYPEINRWKQWFMEPELFKEIKH